MTFNSTHDEIVPFFLSENDQSDRYVSNTRPFATLSFGVAVIHIQARLESTPRLRNRTLQINTSKLYREASVPARPYTDDEVTSLIEWKLQGITDLEIAYRLKRTYWSVVYKWRDVKRGWDITY